MTANVNELAMCDVCGSTICEDELVVVKDLWSVEHDMTVHEDCWKEIDHA